MPDITIAAGGVSFSAYVAKPSKLPAPGLVVAQEIFGVNEVMRQTCDWLAGAGFLAVCPDLFWRIEPGIQITDKTEAEWKRAFELFGLFDVDRGIDDMKSTLAELRQSKDCTGKAGSIGYCLGGKVSYLMAARSDADACVAYYGVGLDELLGEARSIEKPLMLHIAEKDRFVPPEAQAKVKDALAKHPQVTIHSYVGQDHAFARVGGEHYDKEAADLANRRSLEFLNKALGS